MPSEAVDLARLQRRSWAKTPALRAALDQVTAAESTQAWHQAIVAPPLAHCRVLVALADEQVTGFAVTGPSDDPDSQATDGLIAEFVVDEASIEEGHSSRLINAAVDTLRSDGYQVATIWIPSDADDLRMFLVECGWATDGAHQELGTEDAETTLKLVRLHTDIRPDQ